MSLAVATGQAEWLEFKKGRIAFSSWSNAMSQDEPV